MQEWQKGIDLEKLKELAEPFRQRHKALVFGAFGLTKERDVADYLSAGRALWTGKPPRAVALFTIAKAASEQSDFAQRRFSIQPQAIVVKAFAALDVASGLKVLSVLRDRVGQAPVWIEIFEEDDTARAAVAAVGGFSYVTSKVAAGGEIKGVYFSGQSPLPALSLANQATLAIIDGDFLRTHELAAIRGELGDFDNLWAQHYSSYNKRKSWEAFALRGYADDPGFIIKPAEMSKGWKEENPGRLHAWPRMTKAAEHFGATLDVINRRLAPVDECDRIRFMRLRAKGGELSRHADITDREAGTADGMICRMHVPIVTNEAVKFMSWNARGEKLTVSPPAGCLMYLDQRKPHAVTNGDPSLNRVHLVIDCVADAKLREMIGNVASRSGVSTLRSVA
jgi:hypothetical protein